MEVTIGTQIRRVSMEPPPMRPIRPLLVFATLALVAPGPASAQATRAAAGAVAGGVIGATVVGLFGALLGAGLCDAADCSGAWVEGAVPGAVAGGLGGAVVGAAIGALFPAPAASDAAAPRRLRPAVLVGLVAGQAESESVDQNIGGGRVLVGARWGGLTLGPSVERVSRSGWRVTSVSLAARLDRGAGVVRPFAEVAGGRYAWKHPGTIITCTPAVPPVCTGREGTISDAYLGAAGAVGVAVGGRDGRWAVFSEVRYHHSLATTARQLRQFSVGVDLALGAR